MALCLAISVLGLGVKSYFLSLTEQRARDLLERSTPVIEAARSVPELVQDFRRTSSLIEKADSETDLIALQAHVDVLKKSAKARFDLEVDDLLAALGRILALQTRIVRERDEIGQRIARETMRLDSLVWALETEQAQLALELSQITGQRDAMPRMQATLATLAGVARMTSGIGALRATTHDMGMRLAGESFHLKPIFLRETDVIATHLGRMPASETRRVLAAEFLAHKRAMVGAEGVFNRFHALEALNAEKLGASERANALLQKLVVETEGLTGAAVADFRALAARNRVTTRSTRQIDLLVTSLAWVGGVAIFWMLIERNLFARIEQLVGSARILADGAFEHPVRKLASDEVGELEQAVERFRITSLALSSTHAKLTSLLENAPSGIITADQHGFIESANVVMEQMFRLDTNDLIGLNLNTLLPSIIEGGDVLVAPALADADDAGPRPPGHFDVKGHRKTGESFEMEVSLSQIDADGGTSLVGIFRDVSERKAAEAELQTAYAALEKQREELECSNHDLDNFAHGASHDLKAPLRAIRNISGWIEDDFEGTIDAETANNFKMMRSRIQRMERLLDDLLDYSRIGRVEGTSDVVSGAALVHEVVGLCDVPEGFEIETSDKMEELDVEMMPLKNILLNLVSNAIKHHDRGAGRIRISTEYDDGQQVFEVADDGPGIRPEFHQRVLRMFETLQPRDRVEGSGMGLAMVKRQVELRGGRIEIRSGEGRGTAFRFTLPSVTTPEPQRIEVFG
ncbi:ATP-binding protein [Salipiger aestuarii]|uniref:ATP-binding protein n=1 Tax=Salipiger aestuarii TaxID=568098 RepID=UPI001681BB57|nr:ATP-binding protein [Salipiger aestuarii]